MPRNQVGEMINNLLDAYGRRHRATVPTAPFGTAGTAKATRYSGIQTPKKSKPHWLNPGFHLGVCWYPQ